MKRIAARGVTVRVGPATLIADIDLDVAPGEVVALFGANGAGKSTLLAALAGDRRPTRGAVTYDGRDIGAMTPIDLAARRAVLRQKSALAAAFTALEVVQLGQARPDAAAAHAALDAVELGAFAARVYPSLSGGEQQRVQLARVLAQLQPGAALFLDEPAAALDLRQARLVERVARRAAAAGHAVVIVAHDADFVARVADRVVLLRAGRAVAIGAPADVLVSDLVSAAFDLPLAVERTPGGSVVVRPIQ